MWEMGLFFSTAFVVIVSYLFYKTTCYPQTVAMETACLADRSALVRDPKTKRISAAFSHQVQAGFSSGFTSSACRSCAGRVRRSSWQPNMGCNLSSIARPHSQRKILLRGLSSKAQETFWGTHWHFMKFLNQFRRRNYKRHKLSTVYKVREQIYETDVDRIANGYIEDNTYF